MAVDGWAVTFGTARKGLGGVTSLLSPSWLYQMSSITAHPSTASVPIAVLLYNGLLLCGFNVPSKVSTDELIHINSLVEAPGVGVRCLSFQEVFHTTQSLWQCSGWRRHILAAVQI